MERRKYFKLVTILIALIILPRTIMGDKSNDEIDYEKARCSSLSCVHSSALLLQKLDLDVNPCEDFYQFACGGYISEQNTPDEKSTVDTLSLMYEQLIEYLLRLFENPSEDTSIKEVHKFAQNFFDSCMDTAAINEVGMEPLKKLLKTIGGWPVFEENWDDAKFIGWEKTLLAFRKYVNKNDDNLFNYKREAKDKKDKLQGIKSEELDPIQIRDSLEKLISSILTGMGVLDTENIKQQVKEIAEYDRAITEYQLKFKKFRDIYGKNVKQLPEMKKIHKYMLWLDLLEPSVFTQVVKITDDDIGNDFNQKYVDFVKNTSNRTLANFIMWRIVQVSLSFLDKDTRNLVLTFKKNAFGNEDNEQRWIYCTEIITQIAPVAAGSIYIDGYFTIQDKNVADQLVDYIIRAYKDTIVSSDWMDEDTKNKTLDVTNQMHRFIGYHEKMRKPEGYNFYTGVPRYLDHKDFMKTGLTFKIHSSDREFKRLLESPRRKGSLDTDWTKYARPATVNAFYSNKDNSIQFPAGILQSPNFDKDRPPFMNFGAIGSIIGHEVTHSFDDQASRIESWSKKSQDEYKERVKCIINQYSKMRVKEVEEFLQEYYNQDIEFYLNGTVTKNEDIADNGGIKLALKAWQLYEKEHKEAKIRPIGLDNIPNDKMFWLSFADTFCSVERPERMKIKVETDNHSLDKFRVNVPLMNMPEFAEAWKCPLGSTMNPKKKCAVW